MIFDALKLLQAALQQYIIDEEAMTPPIVVLENIALASALGGTNETIGDRVVMSLVNLQEETSLKNNPHYRSRNGRTLYRNPDVNLNLFVLFSVLHSDYESALKLLSRVVEFFQWRKELTFSTTPVEGNIAREVRILADLYTLTFEQLNHLWGALGGKQVPFVLYRTRLAVVAAQKRQGEGPAITDLYLNETPAGNPSA
jgi:hypothetical protein